MILYRGTPKPETTPRKREFPAVYFAKSRRAAAFYGKFIQEYRSPCLRVIKYRSRRWDSIAADFLGQPLTPRDHKNFFLFPIRQWIEWLWEAGYDAMEDRGYVAVFNPKSLKLVARYTATGKSP
jgi:hypothetical protein